MTEPTYPRYPAPDDVPQPTDPAASVAPVAAPAPAPGGRIAQPLGALTWLTIAFAAAYTALMLPRYWLAQDAVDRWERVSADGGLATDLWTPYEVVDLLGSLVLLGAYVTTCLWLWRARTNVEVLAPTAPHARRRGWVWGAWLVPVVSLWFPYQVVRDVLRVRSRGTAAGGAVGWWWALFLVWTSAVFVEAGLVPWDEIDLDLVSVVPPMAAVSTALAVVACVLWVRVVRSIAADQQELLATP